MKRIYWLKEGSYLKQVLEEIIEHVKWTGETIRSADSAMTRSYGFVAETQDWSIPLNILRRDLYEAVGAEAEVFERSIKTHKGRIAIARSFPGQRRNNEPPVFECSRCGGRTWLPGYDASCHTRKECDERMIQVVHSS